MKILGLTGGIACGKSTISQTLRQEGAYIVDGDELSRRLTAPGGAALPAIRERFGKHVFQADGTLDRRALGQRVFADDAARQALDDVMQPLLRQLILEEIGAARAAGVSLCVLDMPLLYEKELDTLCDRVWCAWLPHNEQLARLMARDGFTAQEAESRIASQLPVDEKAARADIVIDTSGSIQYTKEKVLALLAQETDTLHP